MASLHKITLVLMFCLLALGRAEYLKYKDPKQPVSVRVKDLLSRMTLAEKIGQMTQIERENATADALAKYFIGSVLSGGGSVPAPQASAQAWASMVSEMQKGALSTRLGIPIIYGIDAVHGHNNVYKATIFPHNVGLGATGEPDLVKRIGEATALEVRATGIPYVFAPCIAVCRDPRWGRCYESYSEDPKVVQSFTSLISGLQGEVPANDVGRPYVAGSKNVAACAKHYVGDGGTYMGINENNTIIDTHGPGQSAEVGLYRFLISVKHTYHQNAHVRLFARLANLLSSHKSLQSAPKSGRTKNATTTTKSSLSMNSMGKRAGYLDRSFLHVFLEARYYLLRPPPRKEERARRPKKETGKHVIQVEPTKKWVPLDHAITVLRWYLGWLSEEIISLSCRQVECTTALYDGRTITETAGNRLAIRAEMRRVMLATRRPSSLFVSIEFRRQQAATTSLSHHVS